ncbi:MAG: sugar transferase [Ruminococcus sp.]|nr:sugar transferase [Ruminococcus sp.]
MAIINTLHHLPRRRYGFLNAEQKVPGGVMDNRVIVNGNEFYVEPKPVYEVVKRVFDVVAAVLCVILFFWLFAAIAVAIKVNDGGPVLYVSKRVGKFGREFNFYKFRSMKVGADEELKEMLERNETQGELFKIRKDPRITKIGRFLRRTSLDELPQIFNIIKGDISFVGPRSPLPREVANYTEYSMQRLSVIGGLTCYWQISGRSKIDFNGMVKLDYRYIQERGVWTDFKILLRTLPAVIKGDGAY